jgi:hypothetical protein
MLFMYVLLIGQCHFLCNLLQVSGLLVAQTTRSIGYAPTVLGPFRHHSLEVVRINVHNLLQRKQPVLRQPVGARGWLGHRSGQQTPPRRETPAAQEGANAPAECVTFA